MIAHAVNPAKTLSVHTRVCVSEWKTGTNLALIQVQSIAGVKKWSTSATTLVVLHHVKHFIVAGASYFMIYDFLKEKKNN